MVLVRQEQPSSTISATGFIIQSGLRSRAGTIPSSRKHYTKQMYLDSHVSVADADRSAGLGRTRLFHPWGREPEGGVEALMFPCRTLSDLDYPGLRSVTCDVSSRWVLTTVQ